MVQRICYDCRVDSGSFSKLECRMGLIRRFIPRPLQPALLRTVPLVKRVFYFGFRRYCPICRSWLRTFTTHHPQSASRPDASCPVCGSVERQRLAWLIITRKTKLLDSTPKRMLHVAPEPELARRFARIPKLDYISGDLDDARAMVKMDITDIQYPDQSFDVVFCSHVLEHVPDDRKALREFYRILRPRGWALIQVPLISDKTFEDFSVTDPAERERVFGHPAHVRKCGPDYKERMEQAGFEVTCFVPGDVLTEKNAQRTKVIGQTVFLCKKAP